jgi:hypothetical protein
MFPKTHKTKTYKNKNKKTKKQKKQKKRRELVLLLLLLFVFLFECVATSPRLCVCPLFGQTTTHLDALDKAMRQRSTARHHTQRCDRSLHPGRNKVLSNPLLASEANNYHRHYPPF